MSERKIVVPEGMLKAAWDTEAPFLLKSGIKSALESALRWLSENPIVPTDEQVESFSTEPMSVTAWAKAWAAEWQRQMFVAPEPQIPEEIRDLLLPNFSNAVQMVTGEHGTRTEAKYVEAVKEAFLRGQQSKVSK